MTTVNGSAWDESQVRGLQPRALIVTIYGLYAREGDGWLGVGSLISLMGELGVDEPAVRSSISRLKRRGVLRAERLGGSAGYALSVGARAMLDEGDRRIFARPRAAPDDGWVLAVFSVPEAERQKRHMLRSRLSWLGFGTVSAGVWIAPGHLIGETEDVLRRHELTAYVNLFQAGYVGFGDVARCVATWWDLDGLQELYDEFVGVHEPVLSRVTRQRRARDGQAFADYVRALTAWRRLPFLDPGLPPQLLPPGWSGTAAEELFTSLRSRLADASRDHVAAVTGR